VERGRGVNILEDARHSSVLYIYKYFVIPLFCGHAVQPIRTKFDPDVTRKEQARPLVSLIYLYLDSVSQLEAEQRA
jgi:hypothetical protein